MALYRWSEKSLHEVPRSSLPQEHIRERDDLQLALRTQLSILGEDLLFVAEEYAGWQGSQRRIDLLAIDRTGTLVVIELKRTGDGGHMELQALRYAAMISTMTPDHLVGSFAQAHHMEEAAARRVLVDWIEAESALDELSDRVRIVLVSGDFSTEITSTVLWLNLNYATDIRCFRLVTYRVNEDVLIDVQQIIPLPETADFQISQGIKGAAAAAERAARDGRDYTKYDVTVGSHAWTGQSKQTAIKRAVAALWMEGVGFTELRNAILPNRWLPVHPLVGESVEAAFAREYPDMSPKHRWYDLGIQHDGATWVTVRFGGSRTEEHLADLAEVATGVVDMTWRTSTNEDGTDDPAE